MSNIFKEIDIKNSTYHSFDGMTNTKNFDLSKIKIDENSYKNILITLDTWWSKILTWLKLVV